MSLYIKAGALREWGIPDCHWHVGEPMPNLGNARVVSFQADGDELQLILTTMAMGWRGPGAGQAPSPTPETDELVAAIIAREQMARTVTEWVHVQTGNGRIVTNIQAPEWEQYVASDVRVRAATAKVVERFGGS